MAGFHTAKSLEIPENITIMPLPPYSPELNPIENLRHNLKSHYRSNRTNAKYDEIEEAAIEAWRHSVLDKSLIKSLCTAPYTNIATSD